MAPARAMGSPPDFRLPSSFSSLSISFAACTNLQYDFSWGIPKSTEEMVLAKAKGPPPGFSFLPNGSATSTVFQHDYSWGIPDSTEATIMARAKGPPLGLAFLPTSSAALQYQSFRGILSYIETMATARAKRPPPGFPSMPTGCVAPQHNSSQCITSSTKIMAAPTRARGPPPGFFIPTGCDESSILWHHSQGIPNVIPALAEVLETMVRRNEAAFTDDTPPCGVRGGMALVEFQDRSYRPGNCQLHWQYEPVCSLLERMHRRLHCDPDCYILAGIYIQRFIQRQGGNDTVLQMLTVHRILLAALLAAYKFHQSRSSHFMGNSNFAKLSGMVGKEEMNHLEAKFLRTIGYNLFVTEDEFIENCNGLRNFLS